jgi:hypothetical protein
VPFGAELGVLVGDGADDGTGAFMMAATAEVAPPLPAKLAEATLARYMRHMPLTEQERAKQIAEFDAGIQECNEDEARYQAANQPENVAKAVAQRDALRKLRAELLAAKVTE